MRTILTIQYLRAIAALLVVIYHAGNALREYYTPSLPQFEVGAFGVDIFFVISGFIMWTISTAQPTAPGSFYKRRIIRIVPIYWALTLITAYISTEDGFHLQLDQDYATLFRSLFFIPDWGVKYPAKVQPVLQVGWTLNLEMLFYTLFALSLFLQKKYRLPTLCFALLVMGTMRLWLDPTGNPVLIQYSESVILEFGYGALLGWAFANGLNKKIDHPKGWMIALALLTLALALLATEPWMSDVRAIRWGLPALLIVAGGLFLEPAAQTRPLPGLKFLGDASYSIYLAHLTGMAISQKLIGAVIGAQWPLVALMGEVLFMTAFGVAVYLVLEKPLTEITRRLWARDLAGAVLALPSAKTLASGLFRIRLGKTPRPEVIDSGVTVSNETE